MIPIVLGVIFLLLPLATPMPVYYDHFQNNPDHSNDAKDYFQYYGPDDFGNPRSMQGNPTYDADGIGVTTRSYDQVPAAIEPQEEPTNEEDKVTAATEPQEEPTNKEYQVTAATEPQEDLTDDKDQVTAATEPQEDLTDDEDQVTESQEDLTDDEDQVTESQEDLTDDEDQVTETQEDLTNDKDQVFAATEHQEYLIKGPFQSTAATKQQEEMTEEELRDLEVQKLFDVKENKMIDIIIGVGAAVIGLLILLCLGGRQIYLKLKKRRLKSKWKEAKRKKGKRGRVPEVTVEEGLPNDTDAITPQNTPQESPPTTSTRKKATFGLPQSPGSSSEIMNDKQKRGKRKVPEETVEITPQESPPTTSTRKKVTFDLPPLQRSSLTSLSIVPSVESGNTSQSAAEVPLVEFPIDPSNAVTSATIYYGQSSAASSITFQFISKIDK